MLTGYLCALQTYLADKRTYNKMRVWMGLAEIINSKIFSNKRASIGENANRWR